MQEILFKLDDFCAANKIEYMHNLIHNLTLE
jgi:hypothetical protein